MGEGIDRRTAVTALGAGMLALGAGVRAESGLMTGAAGADGKYTLPPLPYDYQALEPYLDEKTMRLHHDKHHQGYVNGLNAALDKLAEARRTGDLGAVKALSRDLAFNGSGHLLHTVFWTNLRPAAGNPGPSDALAVELKRCFGSVEALKAHFSAAAKGVEGSGWGLLVWEPAAGQMLVMQAEKHQNLTAWGVVPLLVLDVWEHAYYLTYQNDRGAYVDAFWKLVDWRNVEARWQAARG